MLLSQDVRDLYGETTRRWIALDSWLNDPANASAVASVTTPIATFQQHWQTVDGGLLSNETDICRAYQDLETAEQLAMGAGYPEPSGYHDTRWESVTCPSSTSAVTSAPTAPVAASVDWLWWSTIAAGVALLAGVAYSGRRRHGREPFEDSSQEWVTP